MEGRDLGCTPHGQVAELQSKPIYGFTQEKSRALAASGSTDGAALLQTVAEVLRLPKRRVPGVPILRPLPFASIRCGTPSYMGNRSGVQRIVYRLTAEPLLSRPPRERTRRFCISRTNRQTGTSQRTAPTRSHQG